jgi:RNA polymerase sigma factor (sigma-70 family)
LDTTIKYSEWELVSLLKNRDNTAFTYLYEHYSGALYGIILKILNDSDLATDLLQEVFMNIWNKIGIYDPGKGTLFTWMLNIARNASIDKLRSKSYQNDQKNQPLPRRLDLNAELEIINPDFDNIGLNKLIGRLNEDQRMLIELVYFKGYTHEEVSVMKSIPLGTVKTRVRNALIQLRSYLT